jgi:hypothetical protein
MEIKKYSNDKCSYIYKIIKYNDIINPDLEIERYNIINKNNCIKNIISNISNNKNNFDPVVPDIYYEEKLKNYKNMIGEKVKYENNKLIYKDKSINLHNKLYKKICNDLVIKLPKDVHINTIIWCILYRYEYLSLLNMVQLAILPEQYNFLSNKYGACLELFGSLMNHKLKYFCSLFYDLEKYFGSRGNHFNITLIKGFYLLNPPFTEDMINLSLTNMLNNLEKNKNIGYFISIPIWDISGRLWVNKNCKIKVKTGYKDLPIIKKLLNNKKLKWCKKYCKEKYQYFDYLSFKKINAAPTYLFLFL